MRRSIVGFAIVAVTAAACGAAPDVATGGQTTTSVAPTENEAGTVGTTDDTSPLFEEGGVSETQDDLVTKPGTGGDDARAAQPAEGAPSGVVGEAMADLAQRLDRPVSDITLVAAEDVTWRDGSLGCPQPGQFYTQALVPGTRIRLAAGGEVYEYHAGSNVAPFYCADPQDPIPNADA